MFVFVNKSLVKLSQQSFFGDLKFLNNHYRFLHWQSLKKPLLCDYYSFLSAEFSVTMYTTEIRQVKIDVDIDL